MARLLMHISEPLLTFHLQSQRCAMALAPVTRVFDAVEVTPWPAAPAIVLGVISVHGCVVPVLDPRQRFGAPPRTVKPDDQFIDLVAAGRRVVLAVDAVGDVLPVDARRRVDADSILPCLPFLAGVLTLDDGLVLIHDLQRFLSAQEGQALDLAPDFDLAPPRREPAP